ncbi:hypothetical protein SKAU_G00098220 [Synaphobranchus kaupii]|uniref:G-protein coupled receptors family 1 profile domain-containing protein n=1 Tax=Synaphobranchus kaupii TaxID=118154 RepID=A0A9Q1FYL8_SYNKA|nr:hypothetical protein SKAU_G00098220 [Synaphobranchus kaupii]
MSRNNLTAELEAAVMMNNSTADCNPRADFQIYLFPTVYCFVFVLGLLGNVGALYVFIFKITPRSSSNIYVINLALADTIFLCTLPFRIHYHLKGNDWVFGSPACLVIGTLFFTNIYISVAFLTCICIDRYIATVHPITYLRLRGTKCTLWVSLAVWTVTGVAMLALILTGPLDSAPEPGGSRRSCFENFSRREWAKRMTAYNACALVFGSIVPLAVIMVCYPLVARRLTRIRTGTSRRALRIIYAILTITTICFLPYAVVHLLHLLMRHQIIQSCVYANAIYKARRLTMALVSLNSCLDPVLYYFTTRHCDFSFFKRLRPRRTRNVYTIN